MSEMLQIRSVKGYFKEFAIEAIGKKHADKALVRQQILDAFQKEIFGQLAMKFGDPEMLAFDIEAVDPETKRQVDNILSNSVRKYKRLCMEFAKYRETQDVIFPSDLMTTIEDIVKAQTEGMTAQEDDIQEMPKEELPVAQGQEYPAGYWTK